MDERSPLISTGTLASLLGAPAPHRPLAIVDASWRMPPGAHARDAYDLRRIPGAVFFDLDAIADPSSGLPHMLPTPALFAEAVGAMGITQDHTVIVYDDTGVFSAPRVWWTFRAMGHGDVRVLNGGLPTWRREGRPVETGSPPTPAPALYLARPRPLARDAAAVRAALAAGATVIDARPAARFDGVAEEPRPGLRSGAMPGAVNIPYGDLIRTDGVLRPPSELAARFAQTVTEDGPVIATCGSGITAAVVLLALAQIGRGEHGLYDGSWAEWGRNDTDPALFPVLAKKSPA